MITISDKNKFLTTFNEKASAKNPAAIRPPHELRKFQDLRILDIAAGLHHILLFAVAKSSPSTSFDITSSDPNENIPIHTWPESDTSTHSHLVDQNRSIEFRPQIRSDFKNIISPRPILAKETLQAIQTDVETEKIAPIEEPVVSKVHIQSVQLQAPENNKQEKPVEPVEQAQQSDQIERIEQTEPVELVKPTEIIIQTETIIEVQTQEETVQKPEKETAQEDQSKSKEQIETMDIVTKGVSNIGDSIMTDIKSMATAGEGKLNDLAKETEKTIKEVPKNVIDYVKTSVGLEKEEDDNVLKMDEVKESAAKNMPTELTDPMISNQMSSNPPMQQIDLIEPIESEKVKQNNKLNRALAEDDSNETIVDEFKIDAVNDEVKFINNGVDVSNSSNIIQAMHDEINEMGNDAKNKADELTMKYDGMLNDEITGAKEMASTKLFEMKNGNLSKSLRTFSNILKMVITLFSFVYRQLVKMR